MRYNYFHKLSSVTNNALYYLFVVYIFYIIAVILAYMIVVVSSTIQGANILTFQLLCSS